MNRKARRAEHKRGKASARPASEPAGPLWAQARQLYRQGQLAAAEQSCRQILAGEPGHGGSHHLLGLIAQAAGQHNSAVRSFAKAVEADPDAADWHYDLALSYQALGRRDRAVSHFTRALTLQPEGAWALARLTQRPAIAGALHRLAASWPKPLSIAELFGPAGLAALAGDAFLHCALKNIWLCHAPLELLLTRVRAELLQDAVARAPNFAGGDEQTLGLLAAIAQQCFINEYVYAVSEEEARQADELRGRLAGKREVGEAISPLLLAAVAAYTPLHTLSNASLLLRAEGLDPLAELLRQQVTEPLEELADRATIPALTAIDARSTAVRRQYEENPYPRWSAIPPHRPQPPAAGEPADILIAGCGTGKHAIDAALLFPRARVLAIDISLASLAYARRKTREAGISNIEYAQADILRLGSIDRRFDRIESIGVLHHLRDPKAGFRALLSLLKPDGVLEVALYSEIARRAVVAARALIAERGYPPTAQGIRACRQEILRTGGSLAQSLTTTRDFYGASGCRDLLFNAMEHRYTLPQIKALLAELDLTLLAFEAEPETLARFQREFPGASVNDLDRWHAFETAHPDTFLGMYRFLVRPAR